MRLISNHTTQTKYKGSMRTWFSQRSFRFDIERQSYFFPFFLVWIHIRILPMWLTFQAWVDYSHIFIVTPISYTFHSIYWLTLMFEIWFTETIANTLWNVWSALSKIFKLKVAQQVLQRTEGKITQRSIYYKYSWTLGECCEYIYFRSVEVYISLNRLIDAGIEKMITWNKSLLYVECMTNAFQIQTKNKRNRFHTRRKSIKGQ